MPENKSHKNSGSVKLSTEVRICAVENKNSKITDELLFQASKPYPAQIYGDRLAVKIKSMRPKKKLMFSKLRVLEQPTSNTVIISNARGRNTMEKFFLQFANAEHTTQFINAVNGDVKAETKLSAESSGRVESNLTAAYLDDSSDGINSRETTSPTYRTSHSYRSNGQSPTTSSSLSASQSLSLSCTLPIDLDSGVSDSFDNFSKNSPATMNNFGGNNKQVTMYLYVGPQDEEERLSLAPVSQTPNATSWFQSRSTANDLISTNNRMLASSQRSVKTPSGGNLTSGIRTRNNTGTEKSMKRKPTKGKADNNNFPAMFYVNDPAEISETDNISGTVIPRTLHTLPTSTSLRLQNSRVGGGLAYNDIVYDELLDRSSSISSSIQV